MTEVMIGGTGTALINILFLVILFVVAIAIARLRSLFAIVMLSGVYSLVSAAWYILVDAVDVGFTEAAVGAGMSTAVLLGAMLLTARTAQPEKPFSRIGPFIVCLVTGLMLIYATIDLPPLGDANSPANAGVASSLIGFSQQAITALSVQAMGFAPTDSPVPVLAFCAIASMLSLSTLLLVHNQRR